MSQRDQEESTTSKRPAASMTQCDSDNSDNEDGDKDKVYSMQDVLEKVDKDIETVNAVLGACDPMKCSYSDGYVYRQALYACRTCYGESGCDENNLDDLHGICLGCSYSCHENHDLFELYTKRKFKCDCGNAKFKGHVKCKLEPFKDSTNELNKYNHNFNGLYCVCNKPYELTGGAISSADTSRSEQQQPQSTDETVSNKPNLDEMLQCIVCEDWFHAGHLLGNQTLLSSSSSDEFQDLVCHMCMKKHEFLWYYDEYIFKGKSTQQNDTNESINVESGGGEVNQESKCILNRLKAVNKNIPTSPSCCLFLDGLRDALCKCDECLQMYKDQDCEFLTSQLDSLQHYEESGKKNEKLMEDKLIDEHINKLDRVARVELIHGVNDFKQDLTQFLTSFASSGQVIKPQDVHKFFEDLQERKKRKLEEHGSTYPAYFCK